ncbi:MAG: NUDIX domain-containing protein [Candidatus Moraniibacteriota bacterium]
MQFFIAVKGIIRRKDGKILILKRSVSDDHLPEVWETVGGGMDTEETPQEALQREIREETGLEVSVGEPFNVFTFRKQTGEFKVGITFLCDTEDDTVVLSHEHSEYRWIEPAEFPNFKSVPSLYEEIDRYVKSVNRR